MLLVPASVTIGGSGIVSMMDSRATRGYANYYCSLSYIPRSYPHEESIRGVSHHSYHTPSASSPGMSSSGRSMKISSVLNDDSAEASQPSAGTEQSRQSSSTQEASRMWRDEVPSPGDATPSLTGDDEGLSDRESNIPEIRENRPAYDEEEDTFIWYHRDDCGMKWEEVSNAFNRHFGEGRRRLGLQGIQGRYYRILKDEGVPKLRDRPRRSNRREYGVVKLKGAHYPWMKEYPAERST